ncbi:MAG: hypothetical protein CMC79_04095 [Flavobacteriaceae bacterium]|nr:hypothetical protein [Flavobacteriaceae bacterium]|tara:strand:+ start:55728 stop:55967 length:240 start_codon:yes stop_codon:yes gene_type:complete
MKYTRDNKKNFLFRKSNYKWLFFSIITIALGFILMTGGGTNNPEVFNYDIFNFRRIRLAPTIVLIGFGLAVYSIIKESK